MKKSILIMQIVLLLMGLTNCSNEQQTCTVTEIKGIKFFNNKNKSKNKPVMFNPIKKFVINNDSDDKNYLNYFDSDMVAVDSKKNIYIADKGSIPKINKYDENGNFISTFLKKGIGPGEVRQATFLCIKNDSIYVGGMGSHSVSIFDINENFVKSIPINGRLMKVFPLNSNRFVGAIKSHSDDEDRNELMYNTVLLDNSFNQIKEINRSFIPMGDEVDLQAETLHLTVCNNKVYLGINDKNNYKINVYDEKGDLIEVISKNFSSINFSKNELGKMNEYIELLHKGCSHKNPALKNADKKNAINGLYTDKYNNLLVQPALDTKNGNTEGLYLDYFEDNEYLNRKIIKTGTEYYYNDYNIALKFFDDKLYLINSEENIVEVYDY